MGIQTTKFIRKPLYVDAVRITNANFDEIVAWCQGEVQQDEVADGTGKKYIKVRVHNPKNPRQTKAFVGDWLLYTERGYKVYTNKAFHASFDRAQVATPEQLEKAFGKNGRKNRGKTEVEAISDTMSKMTGQQAGVTQVEVPAAATEDIPVPVDELVRNELREAHLHSVGPVAGDPATDPGVGEIISVTPQEDETSDQVGEYEPPAVKVLDGESPEMAEARRTIEAEGGTVEVATPQGIAEAIQESSLPVSGDIPRDNSDNPVGAAKEGAVIVDAPPEITGRPGSAPPTTPTTVEDVAEQEKIVPAAAEGKRVLSIEEQGNMDADEIRELIRMGEVVLAQDIA